MEIYAQLIVYKEQSLDDEWSMEESLNEVKKSYGEL